MIIYKLKDGKELQIRTAEEYDAKEIIAMCARFGHESDFLSYGEEEYYFTEEQEKNFIANVKQKDNCLYIIALVDGEIIANLHFLSSQRKRMLHRADIGIAVLKDYWGLGVGTALMDYCLQFARGEASISKIDLEVRADNIRAINLYLKHGFKIEGRIARGICVDNKFYELYKMGMEI